MRFCSLRLAGVACATFLIYFTSLNYYVEAKDQYVQPMMMGMQVAIPYDLANIFNRPVGLGPFVSSLLAVSLLYILFFGVITSPFGYMFGVPSQKYVLGIGSESFVGALVKAAGEWDNIGKDKGGATSRSLATPIIRQLLQYEWEYPDFSTSVFQFTPDQLVVDEVCQDLILCYAHSGLRSLPEASVPLFRVFSKTLTNVTERHRDAIVVGLEGESCGDVYSSCSFDVYSLVARSFTGLVPKWLRRSFMLPKF